jgi:hypothetical protein
MGKSEEAQTFGVSLSSVKPSSAASVSSEMSRSMSRTRFPSRIAAAQALTVLASSLSVTVFSRRRHDASGVFGYIMAPYQVQ